MPKIGDEVQVEGSSSSRGRRKTLRGVVVSDKMLKTIVVKVDRMVRHSSYAKYITRSSKYAAHDESSIAKVGDRVEIIETKPISKTKRWALREVIEKATLGG